jgi:hypothetical protein
MPRAAFNPILPQRGQNPDIQPPNLSPDHSPSPAPHQDDNNNLPMYAQDGPVVAVGDYADYEMSSDIPLPSVKVPTLDAALRILDCILQDGNTAASGFGDDNLPDIEMSDMPEDGRDTLDTPQPEERDDGFEDIDDYSICLFDDGNTAGEDAQDDKTGSADVQEETPTGAPTPPQPHGSSLSSDDPTTAIPHHQKAFKMKPFRAALSLFANKWNVSREQWSDLRSILHLLEHVPDEIALLPKKVDTIKEALEEQLPLLSLRSRKLDLDSSLLPTHAKHKEDMVVFDMRDYFKRLLQSEELMSRAHTSMAQYVDEPTEFWHSLSWGGSNRTTSGQFAKVQTGSHTDDVVLASDFVWWYDVHTGKTKIGRVTFVGVDLTDAAMHTRTHGMVKLSIQPVWQYQQLDASLQKNIQDSTPLQAGQEELFLVEGEPEVRILEGALKRQERKVHLDYNYLTSTASLQPSGRFTIRYVISHSPNISMRPLALSHPLRGELEINTYGRKRLLKNLNGINKTVKCLPYTLFIDAFGLYRNMHRPIPGFYAQFAFMNQLDRKRRINVFPITLAPFAARWEDVVHSLMHLKELETGIEVMLDNGSLVTVCSPCLTYIGDMPQQQANAGCKNQKADHYCRSCLISSKADFDSNITFDIVANGRYHYETARIRNEARGWSKNVKDKEFKDLGLNSEPSPLAGIHKALCIPIAFPGDVAHSEFKGIAQQVLNILFTDILKPQFHETFAHEFALTPVPPTWAQVQNIHKYIGSYSMQEFGRASMITPVVLRRWLQDIHLRSKVPAAIAYVLSNVTTDQTAHEGVDFIVHCYATMARLNAVIMGQYICKQDRDKIPLLVRDARQRMQDLVDIAVAASTKTLPSAATPQPQSQILSRPTSPLNPQREPSSRERMPTYKSRYADETNVSVYNVEDENSEADEPLFGEEEEQYVATVSRIPKMGKLTQSEKEKKRLNALSRKKFTPNVHTILHVTDTITEFGSARNVTTWSGEDKHK